MNVCKSLQWLKNAQKELTVPVRPSHERTSLVQASETKLRKLQAPFQVAFQLFYYNKYTYVCTVSVTAVCMYKCPIVTCMYIRHRLWRTPEQKQAHCEQVLASKKNKKQLAIPIGFGDCRRGPTRRGEGYRLAAELPPRIRTALSGGAWGTVSIRFYLQPEWRVRLTWKDGLASLHTTSGDLRIHATF